MSPRVSLDHSSHGLVALAAFSSTNPTSKTKLVCYDFYTRRRKAKVLSMLRGHPWSKLMPQYHGTTVVQVRVQVGACT